MQFSQARNSLCASNGWFWVKSYENGKKSHFYDVITPWKMPFSIKSVPFLNFSQNFEQDKLNQYFLLHYYEGQNCQKHAFFFAIFLYFLGSHSQCHSWFDFEHSDWLRADFFAWVKFFSDWYLSKFWPDWDKQYLFSEQNFAGNSLKVVSKWLEQNTKLPFVTAQPPATDLYVDQHFFFFDISY